MLRMAFHQNVKRMNMKYADRIIELLLWSVGVTCGPLMCANRHRMLNVREVQPYKLNGIILMQLGRSAPPTADARHQSLGQRLTARLKTTSAPTLTAQLTGISCDTAASELFFLNRIYPHSPLFLMNSAFKANT